MSLSKNDRFLKALKRQPVDCTPVWIMRQAGRYLPEYRRVRQQAGEFMSLCKSPELACEVTLQPLERFDLDAAIVFSDILTIPDAMGLGLHFSTGEGPVFDRPVRSAQSIDALTVPDMLELSYVFDAIRLITRELNDRVPLIGFSGSPWTLATYMVEGQSSKTFSVIKRMMYSEPAVLHRLLNILGHSVVAYLRAQIQAGAKAVMIFDTWGGVLSPENYQKFSLAYMRHIVGELKADPTTRDTPIILFTKNGGQWIESIANTGCDAIGIDWTLSLAEAKARVGDKVALQGNLDPAVLYAPPHLIRHEVQTVLSAFGSGPGHVFNLGHGIHPDVNPDNVKILVDAVHELSAQ